MLGDRSRLVRLLLLAATVLAVVAWPTRHYSAYAATSGDDDDDDAGSGGGGDDGKGGDATAGDDDDDVDADQPPVTAGGLYTKDNFPISALDRPLTLIEGMAEIHAGLNTDLASGDTFGKFGADLLAHYGVKDNLEVQARANIDLNEFTAASVGVEGGLNYDPFAIDVRGSLLLSKIGGETHVGAQIGFPIRYLIKPQIAITALETLMTVNFNAKPDFTPSLGVIAVPVPQIALLLHAELFDAGFEPHKVNIAVPVTVAAQVTPTNKVDIGLMFLLPNILVSDPVKPYDARELELYVNLRF